MDKILIYHSLNFKETLAIAYDSIKISKSRTIITLSIIALGIMSLVGILSSIDAMKSYLSQSFSEMGANSFNIKNRARQIRMGGKRKKSITYRTVSFEEAEQFKKEFDFPATVASSVNASFASTIKYLSNKTNPNTVIIGIDESYLSVSGYKLSEGRNITIGDMENMSPVAVIGTDIVAKLFPNNEKPLDKIISVGGIKMKVVGVLESKGNSAGFGGGDKLVYVPITFARSRMGAKNSSYTIAVQVSDPTMMDAAVSEAEGVFRVVREIRATEENNFEITKSDDLAQQFISNLNMLTLVANIVGFITLIGSLIALMNIMLVTVTERTREIGVRKSLGATKSVIRKQFLYEAITISVLGGIVGILLGLGVGNIISLALGVGFIIPWQWIILAVVISIIVGVLGGYYPANKAAKLNPIDALRFE